MGLKRNIATEGSGSTLAAKVSKEESNRSSVVPSSKDQSTSRLLGQNQVTGFKRKSDSEQTDTIPAPKIPKQNSNVSTNVPPPSDMQHHSAATKNEVSLTM